MVNFIALFVALCLSGVSAYYSIVGLTAIFSSAVIPVILMGSALEMGKLVTASWLYNNWDHASKALRTYLTLAVIVLMFITSMGTFGFLSKAHIDSTMDAGANTIEVKTLVQQEKIVKERLDYLLARAKDPSTAIISSVALMVTLQTLSSYEAAEKFSANVVNPKSGTHKSACRFPCARP